MFEYGSIETVISCEHHRAITIEQVPSSKHHRASTIDRPSIQQTRIERREWHSITLCDPDSLNRRDLFDARDHLEEERRGSLSCRDRAREDGLPGWTGCRSAGHRWGLGQVSGGRWRSLRADSVATVSRHTYRIMLTLSTMESRLCGRWVLGLDDDDGRVVKWICSMDALVCRL